MSCYQHMHTQAQLNDTVCIVCIHLSVCSQVVESRRDKLIGRVMFQLQLLQLCRVQYKYSVPLSACLPACLPACLSVCQSVCLPVCLCLSSLGKSLWKLFLEQFDDLLVKILLGAAVVSFVSAHTAVTQTVLTFTTNRFYSSAHYPVAIVTAMA